MAKQEDAFYPKACKELTDPKTLSAVTNILSVMTTAFHQSCAKVKVKCHHLPPGATSSDKPANPYLQPVGLVFHGLFCFL